MLLKFTDIDGNEAWVNVKLVTTVQWAHPIRQNKTTLVPTCNISFGTGFVQVIGDVAETVRTIRNALA